MKADSTKTTLYLSTSVRKALKKRVVDTNETMSEYVDRALVLAIAEDLEDIEAIEARRGEPTESLDEFLRAARADGLI
jgi:hypothetical protein